MMFRRAIFPFFVCLPLALAGCSESAAENVQADLTIYLSGDLWEHGGVVHVNPIPVPEARWREVVASENVALAPPGDLRPIAPDGKRMTVTLDKQFGDVQFLYPAGRGKYTFRFRPHPGQAESPDRGARVLSIGGVQEDTGLGEEMAVGFTGMPTSGFQFFHIVAPDTNERSARVLSGLADRLKPKDVSCTTRSATSVCTFADDSWPGIVKEWAKGKLELDQEYRRMDALKQCYDGAGAMRGKGTCEPTVDGQGETTYTFRRKAAS